MRPRIAHLLVFQFLALGAPAATLHVRVHRNPATRDPLTVAVLRESEQATPALASRSLAADANDAVFEGLDAGAYVVLVKGRQPLARASAKAVVGANDRRTVDVELPVGLLAFRVTLGGTPLAGAEVSFRKETPRRWETTASTDAKGEIHSALWEEGTYTVAVRGAGLRAPVVRAVHLTGGPVIQRALDIPMRSIRGRVVDRNGAPVAGATVALRTGAGELLPLVRQTTDASGVFEFAGVLPGPQTVHVLPNGYLRPAAVTFDLSEKETRHEVDYTIDRGQTRSVAVVDAHGDPVANASIVCAADGVVRSETFTDALGRASVATPGTNPSVLYVFPREGSLVIQRVSGTEPLRIVVPRPTSSLRIVARTNDGAPIPDVALLMRVNGEVVPPDAARTLARQQNVVLETDENGVALLSHIPPGTYEFWPYRGEREADALLASAFAMAAPISVNVVTGENEATVRFQKHR